VAGDHDILRFGDFALDRTEHSLLRAGEPVALNPRYLDVLAVLASNPGELISRERFFDEVWRGRTVGDEALTQAIKDLRRSLSDDAAAPRFIQTVPKRGYRFIADVEGGERRSQRNGPLVPLVLAGAIGGGAAGLVGGFVYGLIAGMGSSAPLPVLVVMTTLTAGLALAAGLFVAAGMALSSRVEGRGWMFSIAGAGIGGFLIGELFHRIASDSFSLFLGSPHDQFTGGLEGLILGAGLAAGATFGGGINGRWPRPAVGAAIGGAVAGITISLLGGRLMASSLAALARRFHGSQLELGPFGRLSSTDGYGALVQALAAGTEGLLFGAGVAGAILLRARRFH
jgi:DNA-binding winged helix-turn-helix (wHTH) protein